MYRLDLHSPNLSISASMRAYVERRLAFALRRFSHRVERIAVSVVDVNGPKGGVDKACRLVAYVRGLRPLIVEETASSEHASVSQAAARLEEHVARALDRRRARRPMRGRRLEAAFALPRRELARVRPAIDPSSGVDQIG